MMKLISANPRLEFFGPTDFCTTNTMPRLSAQFAMVFGAIDIACGLKLVYACYKAIIVRADLWLEHKKNKT